VIAAPRSSRPQSGRCYPHGMSRATPGSGSEIGSGELPLEHYYCGDEAYARFAMSPDPALDEQIRSWPGWPELLAACDGDVLLARPMLYHLGTYALAWLKERPPVLEGLSGEECMTTPHGRLRLRTALQRFPC
jgi:hypothetical protein